MTEDLSDRKHGCKMMICGDSMTQGGEGDWTWRYRLWQWLQHEDSTIQFTGPYVGTQEADAPSPPHPPPLYRHHEKPGSVRHHGGYAEGANADFDSHHFSVWGQQCAVAKDLIEDTLTNNPADLLLVMLGFNDIGWFVSDAPGTIKSMAAFITNARKANPKVKIALANIPHRTHMDGRDDLPIKTDEYNKLLSQFIPGWTTEDSPIHLVKLREEYDAEVGSYDGLHPNALGEYQIARAFSLSVVQHFGVGSKALVIPKDIPARPLPTPQGFSMVSSPTGVTAEWKKVYGCHGYEFRSRSGDGEFSTAINGSNRLDSHWASSGERHEAQVRACYGEQRSEYTRMLSAVSRPSFAPAPRNIQIRSAEKGIVVEWDPPVGSFAGRIVQYNILWNDHDEPDAFLGLAAFKQSPAHVDELREGHTIDLFMLTWTEYGEGLPGPMQRFVVGS